MNRVKFWVFTLLVVAVGYLGLHAATASRRADVAAALDARLASAAAHVTASARALGREAAIAAALVARDEALVAALHAKEPAPPPAPLAAPARGKKARGKAPAPAAPDYEAEEARLREAARAALDAVEKGFGFDLPPGTVVTAGNREWIARKGEASVAEGDAMGFLRSAISGQLRRGFVRLNGALWFGAARPAGEGAGVLVLAPIDEAWARALATGAGADVTLSVPEVKPLTTANPTDLPALQGATKLAGAGDVGKLGGVDVSVGPLRLPKLPQPMGGGAALRARAIPLEGVKGAFAIVSIPSAAPLDAAAAFHWRAALGLLLVLLVGLVVGFFVRSTEPTPQVPEGLLTAATRIEAGDFSARAPRLAGKLGTVAEALNHAAELAGPAQAAQGALPPVPQATSEWFQGPARPAPAPEAPAAAAPEAARPAPAAGGPAFEVDEETHWQQVFQDFLRTRATCGEPSESLTYDKFRQKLEGNKAQLVSKYGCKTVRFQVYVKDGKAALKATPVK